MNLLKDVPIHAIYNKIQIKKGNAKVKCTLTYFSLNDVIEMIGDGNCQYSGKPFKDLEDITFERINPKKGYVQGNVVMVNKDSNNHKSLLDSFVHRDYIPDAMKIKLMRKALYQLEKEHACKD